MSARSGCRWGTHAEFAGLYERFLDTVYPPDPLYPSAGGRRRLAVAVAEEIRLRDTGTVLDCAAGTGFPGLDLAIDLAKDKGFTIHCSDGDPAMAAILAERAARRGLHVSEITPPRRPGIEVPPGQSPLVLDWTELERIPDRYDHVLCRGNSLAYADTWTGRSRVANELAVATYLERMLRKVRPGGHLYVDAPWQLELPTQSHRAVGGSGSVWEQVVADDTHREWTLSFKLPGERQPVAFRRYSSLLTIDRVQSILKALGMDDTAPFQLDAERPTFGTIIARRPTQPSASRRGQPERGQRRLQIRVALQAEAEITLPQLRRPTRGRQGTHTEFVERYERYLDAIYERDRDGRFESGRRRLMHSVAEELRKRRVVDVLDCAAGTGFPMVDLAAEAGGEFRIHCSDGDGLMIEALTKRAEQLQVPLATLIPPRDQATTRRPRQMVLDWTELHDVSHRYDYVLCRGNSLAYAGTWGGDEKVVAETLLTAYLAVMATKIRPGGYLHVDAPWTLGLEAMNRTIGTGSIWEQVSVDRDRREWWVKFTDSDGQTIGFKRYSSLITIDRLQAILDRLGFEDTEPFTLDGERDSFGAIIARKPQATSIATDDSTPQLFPT